MNAESMLALAERCEAAERARIVEWLDTLAPGQFLDMEPREICSVLAAGIEAGVHHQRAHAQGSKT